MVYIHSWQEYQDAAEALYAKSPNNTRYCVKWKSSEGKLVLKVTDDIACIKFKTYSSIFLNRFEALNLSLMQKMQNRRPDPPSSTAPVASSNTEPDRTALHAPAATISTAPVSSSGVKKKKPKKKK